ncbi:MAG: 50S ribosomal protein L35 [Candidatus Margulisbacteria bacterium]|nr:50S ribosomal protein L35 [Candidatus Margulisiibacteriota bacterium]
MPKTKTRKAAQKRFKITASGKVMRRCANNRHLLECKSGRKIRSTRKGVQVAASDIPRVRSMLPGGGI